IICRCCMAFSNSRVATRTTRKRAKCCLTRAGVSGRWGLRNYSVRDSTDVSGQRFVEAVCTNAGAFFSKEVSIDYEAAAGFLPKETAVPLALALNELLTNAAKHGANDSGEVTINVGLSQRSGEIELYVQDRGPGFNFD